MYVAGILVAQQIIEAFHTRRRKQPPQHDVLERDVQAVVEPAQVRGAARTQLVAANALLDELDLSGVDLRWRRGLSRRRQQWRFLAQRRHGYGAAAQFEGDNSIAILVFKGGAAGWDGSHRDRAAAVAHLDRDILLAVDRVGHRRCHDVASGLDYFQYLAGIRRINPQLAAAAALENQISARRHHAAVVAANSRRSFVFPDNVLRDRIPGPNQFADWFDVAHGSDRLAIWHRAEQPLRIDRIICVIGNDALDGKKTFDV